MRNPIYWISAALVLLFVLLIVASFYDAKWWSAHKQEYQPQKTMESRMITTYVKSGDVMIPVMNNQWYWSCECGDGGHWR